MSTNLELRFPWRGHVEEDEHVLQDVCDWEQRLERSAVDNGPRRGVREESLGEQLGSGHVRSHGLFEMHFE